MTAFLTLDDLLGIHSEQIRQFGGASGIRDEGLLESALYRPMQKANYGVDDIMELAASLLFGIARNHPFIDGNKRTAFTATDLFLFLNGYSIEAQQEEIVAFVLDVAAGEITEVGAAMFFRDYTVVIGE